MTFLKPCSLLLSVWLILGCLSGCGGSSETTPDASAALPQPPSLSVPAEAETLIQLSDSGITANAQPVGAEQGAVYISHDIIYYEDRDTYESGNPYGEGTQTDRHTADEAAAHTVVNITTPGRYVLSGQLSKGQIRVDLGEDAAEDPTAVVTLVLDNLDITCDVAPAILFLNVYECDNGWDTETADAHVDTSDAGANLILADESENNITGSYVARIYKDNGEEKKLWKQDGALYSYMSMNVDGAGTLNLTAANEGLDSELHLTINGGNINIFSQNDGINTNEDGVSVTTINGGNLHIVAGLGEEGDGIDSNGWLVINGGTVISSANPAADAGLDSDMGSYINGGTVVALGSTMDWAESDSDQVTMNLQFAQHKESDCAIVVTRENGGYVFAYDPSEDEVLGEHTRKYAGAILSCPNFSVDDSYHVYIGGTLTGTETAGVYDIQTVTAYEDGTQQGYTGTDVMMRPGGMGTPPDFGGPLPEGGMPQMNQRPRPDQGNMAQMPEPPEGGIPQHPEREIPQMPEPPEGGTTQFPEGALPQMGGRFPGQDNGDGTVELRDPSSSFYMQDKVNFFSSVTDWATE